MKLQKLSLTGTETMQARTKDYPNLFNLDVAKPATMTTTNSTTRPEFVV